MSGSRRMKALGLLALLVAIMGAARLWGGTPPSATAASGNPVAAGKTRAAARETDAGNAGRPPEGSPDAPGTESSTPAPFPVVTVAPATHSFNQIVRAYGLLQADVRSRQIISMATVGVVRSVAILPGERVKRGQPLFTVEPDPLAYLASQQAVSAAKVARADFERLKLQRADGLATAAQVDAAGKAVADADAGLEVARRQGAAGGSEILRSPTDGVVSALQVGIGDRPAVGAPLAEISPAGRFSLTLGIEPAEAAHVHVGDRLSVHAVPGGGPARTARIVVVGAAIDRNTRMVPVTAVLDEAPPDGVVIGSYAIGEIEIRPIKAFLLPRTAIVTDAGGTAVFEIRNGRAHRVSVTVEVDDGMRVGVSGELSLARRVATTGAYELEDGVAVVEQKP